MSSLQVADQSSRGTPPIEPIYERLPRGPHGLGPAAVARHQRMRIHGAMVEAVALEGYQKTTVKQVIGLAGVSRRAFYEQFADKRSCFLSTFDLIAARWLKRVDAACRNSKGDLRTKLRSALRAFVEEISSNPKSAHLVLIDSEAIGPDGPIRLRRTATAFERVLCTAFASSSSPGALSGAVARGIVGGIQRTTRLHLLQERGNGGRTVEAQALAREMLRWTMLFDPSSDHGGRAGSAEEDAQQRDPSPEEIDASPLQDRRPTGDRAKLLSSVLFLAAEEGYEDLGPVRIADNAGTSLDAFLEMFDGRDACFLAAFDALSDELLAIAADPSLVTDDWASSVQPVVGSMMRRLAENPLYAHTIGTSVYAAGPEAIERNFELARDVASLLTEGAPGNGRGDSLQEWIAGAIWQIVQAEGDADRAHLLPERAGEIAYIVLAPFLGPKAAREHVEKPA